ncbi:MAG: OB-fold nucleic acid binding domain [Candidatus Bathyarchaeota archaeon B26-2]|nr:MAG: OB-fold nucleic acid binding domain [Candidatus Bathyarchaeota archaeon B26-2]
MLGEAAIEYTKVGNLKPNFVDVNAIVKVVSVGSPRTVVSRRSGREHRIAEALVGDETGSVVLTLRDEMTNMLGADEVIEIRGGYTTLYKGSLRLNVGRDGDIRKVDVEIANVNTKNNLSQITHIQIPWKSYETGPFRKKRRRGTSIKRRRRR